MDQIQPGTGYNFKASSSGFTLDIDKAWVDYLSAGVISGFHPFKVIANGTGSYNVVTGAVNNSIPTNMTATLAYVGAGSVWVKCGYDATNKKFPDPADLEIAAGATLPDSTTSDAYVLLATVNAGEVNQIVTGSLWGDRIQVGSGETQNAHYYFARV
jgi:hypothetical protein